MTKALESRVEWLVAALVLSATGFALYTGGAGPFPGPVQRGMFVLLTLPLVFLLVPSGFTQRVSVELTSALVLSAASGVVSVWNLAHIERLSSEPFLGGVDIALGAVGLMLVLEAVRRTVGLAVTLLIIGFLGYALFGAAVPVVQLRHGGLDLETLVSIVFYGTDGVFGTPIGVCATFIVVIVMLGALLTASGGAQLLMTLARAVAGGLTGGPAKIAVIGSALMGMVTGATVANVATTGPVTIPMMKRAGYDAHFAGAVEALASSGGQLMPPIMGAAAFLMIDYLDMSYGQLVIHALVPALLFFCAVLFVVHIRSMRMAVPRGDRAAAGTWWAELKSRGHILLPLVVLVVLMVKRFSIMYAAFWSVVAAMVLAAARPATRLGARGYYDAFRQAMVGLGPLVAICLGAGVLIGVLTATGLNLKLTYLIESVAQGSLFVTLVMTMVACLIVGMGLPTVAAYVVLATLVPDSLINLGVSAVAAHLFIFYFAILSAITPPVCTSAYVAAGIAGAHPVRTGFVAMRLGIVVFFLPFAFVYDPALLLLGSPAAVAFRVGASTLGIFCWVIGLEGFWRHRVGATTRATLAGAGVAMMWPSTWVTAGGVFVGAATLARLWVADRERRQVSAAGVRSNVSQGNVT